MNQRAWEHHLEQLPDTLAALRIKNLLLHSRLAKANRRADRNADQRDQALAKLRQAEAELRWRRADDQRRSRQ